MKENGLTTHAHTLANCLVVNEDGQDVLQPPVVSCNRAVTTLKLPEFFESEEQGVTPGRSCRRCRNCKDCSYRGLMISREKEMVVRRMEDLIIYKKKKKVSVSYPWTEDVYSIQIDRQS